MENAFLNGPQDKRNANAVPRFFLLSQIGAIGEAAINQLSLTLNSIYIRNRFRMEISRQAARSTAGAQSFRRDEIISEKKLSAPVVKTQPRIPQKLQSNGENLLA